MPGPGRHFAEFHEVADYSEHQLFPPPSSPPTRLVWLRHCWSDSSSPSCTRTSTSSRRSAPPRARAGRPSSRRTSARTTPRAPDPPSRPWTLANSQAVRLATRGLPIVSALNTELRTQEAREGNGTGNDGLPEPASAARRGGCSGIRTTRYPSTSSPSSATVTNDLERVVAAMEPVTGRPRRRPSAERPKIFARLGQQLVGRHPGLHSSWDRTASTTIPGAGESNRPHDTLFLTPQSNSPLGLKQRFRVS